jgi:hypothetical protein
LHARISRQRQDDVLVLTLRKQRSICLNPDIRLFDPATGAKPRFTGMGDFFLIPAIGTLVVMEAHLFGAAFKHFLHIAGNTGTRNSRWVEFGKRVEPIGKDLF